MKNNSEDSISIIKLWDDFRLNSSETSYEKLYRLYVEELFNYGRRFSADNDLIQDAVHDLFVRLWKNRKNIGPTTSVKFYLLRSLRREVFKQLKNSRRQSNILPQDYYEFAIEISYETQLITKQHEQETAAVLKKAIDNLPPRQKEALFLKFYENMEFEQIAKTMDVEIRSVYKFIYKALDRLQHLITNVVLFIIALFMLH